MTDTRMCFHPVSGGGGAAAESGNTATQTCHRPVTRRTRRETPRPYGGWHDDHQHEPNAGRVRRPGHPGTVRRASGMQKRVLAGGSVGQFIEFYDFTLYGLSAVVLSQLFFPGASPLAGLLATFATFGVAFLVRPLGGLFFGSLGDKIGRRKVLYVTLLSIGAATALIGLLPTYATIGALAPLLLVLCRMVQGFSAGGESVGAPAFVFEHAPLQQAAASG